MMTVTHEEKREKLKRLLGKESSPKQVAGEVVAIEERPEYEIIHYLLTLNSLEAVPAICVRPRRKGPHPVAIFQHSHGGNFEVGKSELLEGASYLAHRSFAEELCALGYAVWAIDAWGFESRRSVAESELFKRFLIQGQTLWGMRLFDAMRLIDFIEMMEDMDCSNLVTIGMSMGGLLSWWLAALDNRVKYCIDIAGQASTEYLCTHSLLDKHGYYLYLPNQIPTISTVEIQQLIAPRSRLSITGYDDPLCPVEGVKELAKAVTEYYQQEGYHSNFETHLLSGVHQETEEMRALWKNYLKGKNENGT